MGTFGKRLKCIGSTITSWLARRDVQPCSKYLSCGGGRRRCQTIRREPKIAPAMTSDTPAHRHAVALLEEKLDMAPKLPAEKVLTKSKIKPAANTANAGMARYRMTLSLLLCALACLSPIRAGRRLCSTGSVIGRAS